MRVAEAINVLLPNAQYAGNVDDNTQTSFDKVTWVDARRKPEWSAVAALLSQESSKDRSARWASLDARVDKFILRAALALAQKAGEADVVARIQERLNG